MCCNDKKLIKIINLRLPIKKEIRIICISDYNILSLAQQR